MIDGDDASMPSALTTPSARELAARSPSLVRRGLEALPSLEPRRVSFPVGRSLGKVLVLPRGELMRQAVEGKLCLTYFPPEGVWFPPQGVVEVPPISDLVLRITDPGDGSHANLRPLADLGQDDLQAMLIDSDAAVRSGQLAHLRGLTGLQLISFGQNIFNDTSVAQVGVLTQLRGLCLNFSRLSDHGVACLRGMTELRFLELMGTRMTDEGLSILSSLGEMQSIDLSCTPITGSGLRLLPPDSGLKRLSLSSTAVDDAGLAHIGRCAGLRDLNLSDTRITDEGLAVLADCECMESLSIPQDAATREGIYHLARLPILTHLTIGGLTSETGLDLSQLRPLASLKSLIIASAYHQVVSDRTVMSLVGALRGARSLCDIGIFHPESYAAVQRLRNVAPHIEIYAHGFPDS